ncbi:MAG: hypothetical protein ACE5SV_05930 [Candidatus Nitrosomaritimum aestuariumsis]|jgi:hypothetical protein|uniref:Uncharacterized protein n=1 Tax=Candidatus Nitrosomaritimum aestuariumsis TaxID=3342354 RepID=A0AC60VXC7_9ARCH|nr:hypothetical protein [Nitrosopumilaceae archaeon]NCF22235.1 hypothetical protein [Nitrosopumilaceae archaeon]
MITKKEKLQIFVDTVSRLKKTTTSEEDRLNERDLIIEKKAEKFRRLPLD